LIDYHSCVNCSCDKLIRVSSINTHFFTHSLSSFHNTWRYNYNLLCCSTAVLASLSSVSHFHTAHNLTILIPASDSINSFSHLLVKFNQVTQTSYTTVRHPSQRLKELHHCFINSHIFTCHACYQVRQWLTVANPYGNFSFTVCYFGVHWLYYALFWYFETATFLVQKLALCLKLQKIDSHYYIVH